MCSTYFNLIFVIHKLVNECTEKNRKLEPDYQPLLDVVRDKLHMLVGDDYWRLAQLQLENYLLQRENNEIKSSMLLNRNDSIHEFIARDYS